MSNKATGCLSSSVDRGRSSGPDPEKPYPITSGTSASPPGLGSTMAENVCWDLTPDRVRVGTREVCK